MYDGGLRRHHSYRNIVSNYDTERIGGLEMSIGSHGKVTKATNISEDAEYLEGTEVAQVHLELGKQNGFVYNSDKKARSP